MTVRKLDPSGDITTSGEQFAAGVQEIAQTIKTRLQLFLGEYFRDITDGTDWFGRVLGKGLGIQGAEAELKMRIVRTPDVQALTGFSMIFDEATRKLTVTCSVLTATGESTSVTIGSIV